MKREEEKENLTPPWVAQNLSLGEEKLSNAP